MTFVLLEGRLPRPIVASILADIRLGHPDVLLARSIDRVSVPVKSTASE